MEEKTVACGNLAMAFSAGDWAYGTDNSGVAGYSSGYKVAVLRFDVPAVPGAAKYLDVGMVISKVTTADATVRWAVCRSDANRGKYLDTSDEVTDENQVASGTIPFEGLTNTLGMRTFRIPVKGIRKGTWYLILWASELKGIYIRSAVSSYGEASVSVVYTGGIVRIKTPEGVKAVGVYNGQRKRLIPHVKTPTGVHPTG